MNRRFFLRNSSVASLSLTAVAAASCNHPAKKHELNAGSNEQAFVDNFSLNEITIDALQQKMAAGELTSQSITEQYLQRIEDIDKKGPAINAVIEVNPDAVAIAIEMDKERKAGKVRGPMHGIPILIKDNINTGDKMMTTAGSLAMLGNIASQDAFVVKQLRAAGAILLGKTNLSEWANFRSNRSTSGWSSRGGQTKNACILDRNPSGSSSGSGAAVAANLCVVALGSETDGSVIAPSSHNGITGMKPTVGLVSRSGIIPISATQDTAGPMAKTVKDLAILLGAMTGMDEADAVTKQSAGKAQTDYTKFLDAESLKGKKIGYEKSFLKGHEGVVALYNEAINLLKSKGATLLEIELKKQIDPLGEDEYNILQYEFKDGLNKYLSHANAKVKSLADVIAYNKANEPKAMPYFMQDILESSEAKGPLTDADYIKSIAKTTGARKMIDDLMKSHQLDALMGTSLGPAGYTDHINGDYSTGFYFGQATAMAGYPHITVPMGHIHDLPVGVSFISTAYDEPGILSIAYAYEQATKKRKAPAFKKTLEG